MHSSMAQPASPLHTRPIDPISRPLRGNLVSPRSPCAGGAMHQPTSVSVRSSSLDRPLLTSPRVLCAHTRALSWHGKLQLSLWLGLLLPLASLKMQLCHSHCRAAPAGGLVRQLPALRPEVLAVCMVAVSAVACAVPGLSFSPSFDPEALSRCIRCRGGEI